MTSLTGTGICFLASVLVTSSQESWRFTGDNVALNKVAEQGPGTYYVYDADLAVDGNTDTSASNGECSVTTRGYNTTAYWAVNLVDLYILKGIRLYNTYNTYSRVRLGNFQIIGYPSGTLLHDDSTATPQLYSNLVIDIPVNTTTAFSSVTVRSPAHTGWPDSGLSQLTLCEVEIYSSSGETVNGDWTAWSDWTSCSVTCGSGLITRTRTCTNPAPQNGGADCSGYSTDNLSCELGNCPNGGGWTDWSSWTSCSVTCGTGFYTRTRTCTNPVPQSGGADCAGDATENIACYIPNCSDGGWTDWSSWSACSVTCGTGEITRARTCTNPAPQNNGNNCSGNARDESPCALGNCTKQVTTCSVTCGTGEITRTRACTNPAPQNNGADCVGYATADSACVLGNCPIDGGWTDWSAWTACSVTCGTGEITRTRACTNPAPQNNGVNCSGNATDESPCALGNCIKQFSQIQECAEHTNATLVGVACGAFAGGLGIGLLVMFVMPKCKRRTAKPPPAGEGIYCTPQETQPTDIHNYDTLSL